MTVSVPLLNVAFVAVRAPVPILQVVSVVGTLRDALDWVAWLNGLTRGRTWLLLASVLLAAGLVAVVRSASADGLAQPEASRRALRSSWRAVRLRRSRRTSRGACASAAGRSISRLSSWW
ncbi:hypothetical protein GCM10023350_22540 [Nocardioides endophyticus]|uniref:Uncharacterized protein n=1 Tax=Nocardioides endophyticus TaxID=1353775 RepID=A0ABP8YT44_9ACTN